jgi:ParB family chromosome partitioning protein
MADVETVNDRSSDPVVRADRTVPIEQIVPNPDQPRRHFTPEQLEELSASIKARGVIQPLIVRQKPGSDTLFEIVAGERRWRAAQMAQLHELPVLVREFSDIEVLEVAIIENIQRADLNAIEEAAGYRQLMDRFGHTQERMAEALGKSRSHIANLLRLLNLPDDVQEMVVLGDLSAGHARALITSKAPSELAKKAVASGWSVRDVEKAVKKASQDSSNAATAPKPRSTQADKDADTRALEADLSAALGMKVSVDHKAGSESGQLVIRYNDLEQLDDLCRILGGG